MQTIVLYFAFCLLSDMKNILVLNSSDIGMEQTLEKIHVKCKFMYF